MLRGRAVPGASPAARRATKLSHAVDDEFAQLAERYRRQLHVHCYRMLGSFDDAEDLVQETFLRAWRGRAAFEGRSLVRTWLYRIATNACLNALQRDPKRRVLPRDVVAPVSAATDPAEARDEPPWAPELPWLQPYPDQLLNQAEDEPDAVAIARETIEIAYLAALQHLPPRQRAILILRDVLGWSANEVAQMLELTVTGVNSALQRARSTMRTQLPNGRESWTPAPVRGDQERDALRQFMAAWERADADLLTSLLRDDARWSMPPAPLWFDGKEAIAMLYRLYPIASNGEFSVVATSANRQPAVATYLRRAGDDRFRFTGVQVLRIEAGKIAEVVSFDQVLCHHFGLPPSL